jgi:uncharacterized OsmC-like protein
MHDVSHVEIGESKMKNDQRYNALRNLDNESDSSTEVGGWDLKKLRGHGKRRADPYGAGCSGVAGCSTQAYS